MSRNTVWLSTKDQISHFPNWKLNKYKRDLRNSPNGRDRPIRRAVNSILEERGYNQIIRNIPTLQVFMERLRKNNPEKYEEMQSKVNKHPSSYIVKPLWNYPTMEKNKKQYPSNEDYHVEWILEDGNIIPFSCQGEDISYWDDVEFLGYGMWYQSTKKS